MKTLTRAVCLLSLFPAAVPAAETDRAAVQTVVRCAGYDVVGAGRRAKRIEVHKPFELTAGPEQNSGRAPSVDGVLAGRNRRAEAQGLDPADAQRWAAFYRQQMRDRPSDKSRDPLTELLNPDAQQDGPASAKNWGWLSREAQALPAKTWPGGNDPAGRVPALFPSWAPPSAAIERQPADGEPPVESAWPGPLTGGAPDPEETATGVWKAGKR